MYSTIFYICDREACDECSEFCFHTTDITHAKNFMKSPNPLCITEYNYWEIDEKDRIDDGEEAEMAALSNIYVKKELRLCKVNEELGYFHCWEQYSDALKPGLTIGSAPGGQYSRIFAIVEFPDRVARVEPFEIKFVDEEHSTLAYMNKGEK